MATITVDADASVQRIGVRLLGWSADGTVTIYREQNGARSPVRGATPIRVSAGEAFVWDYEAAFGAPARYIARNGSSDVFSAEVTLDETRAWLRAPGLPMLDHPVVPDRLPATSRTRPSATLRPIGRRRPVVLTDVLQSEEGEIGFIVADDEEALALLAILEDSPVVLLQIPGTRWGARYVSVGDVTDAPLTGYADDPGARISFPFVVVDRPEGGLFGDPTNSYQAVLDTFSSYEQLRAAETDYLDVLRGVVTG